jgi:hypothetical protein
VLPLWRSADCCTCAIAVCRPLPRVLPQLDNRTWIACVSGGWPAAHPGLAARCAHVASFPSAADTDGEAEDVEEVGEAVALDDGDAGSVAPGADRPSWTG